MRLHRFFITQPLGEELVVHDKDVLSQWYSVFRYKESDSVIVFNGIDKKDYIYSFSFLSRKEATLSCVSFTAIETENVRNIILCLSFIKKDNVELVIQKSVELGVLTFILFSAERSEKRNIDKDRLYRIAKEAIEQCGRTSMPSFIFEKNTHDAISLVSSLCKAEHVCTLAMGGIPISTYIHTTPFDHSSQKALFIGPEGGWSADEISLFRESGLQDVSLTKTTLRAETAAIASLSYLFLC